MIVKPSTGRASCHLCNDVIQKGEKQVGEEYVSMGHESYHWYHASHFLLVLQRRKGLLQRNIDSLMREALI
jgi:hypothetical protein